MGNKYLIITFMIVWSVFLNRLFAQCPTSSCGANIVPNGNFELSTTDCDTNATSIFTDVTSVQNWFGTNAQGAGPETPDYYAICSGGIASSSSCVNGGSIGGITHVGATGVNNNSREYMQAKLATPLEAGKKYCFSMRVWSRSNGTSTDGFGIWFHDQGIITNAMNGGEQFMGPGSVINAFPQIEQPLGTLIDMSCQTIEGQICAQGGEEWILIGNFREDSVITKNGFLVMFL